MDTAQASTVNAWLDVAVPVVIAFFGAAIAAFWPWLQVAQRRQRFQGIIRRELQEIGPYPEEPNEHRPWWEHANKRFVHEELFRRDAISDNRDFILSLNPTVTYQISQLWIALEKRDGNQWIHFLEALADNRKTTTPELQEAYEKWRRIIDKQRSDWLQTMGTPSSFRQEGVLARSASLFEKRFEAYSRLLPLTEYGSEVRPKVLDLQARRRLANDLRLWFYSEGAGLLLSGRALTQFQNVRRILKEVSVEPARVRDELSQLRTDIKIDLGVRQPSERNVMDAWPEEERW